MFCPKAMCAICIAFFSITASAQSVGARPVSLRAQFEEYLLPWAAGNSEKCAALFEGQGPNSLAEITKRRHAPTTLGAHEMVVKEFKREGATATTRVRLFYMVPRSNGATGRQLLVVDETFTLRRRDEKSSGIMVTTFESAVVTETAVKEANATIDFLLRKEPNVQRPIAGLRVGKLIVCSLLWQIGEPKRAWPVVKELAAMDLEKSGGHLSVCQNIVRKLVALELPPPEHREVVEQVLKMQAATTSTSH